MTGHDDDPIFYDAVLRPNPPLSARSIVAVLSVVAATNFLFGMGFVLQGAWPIMPFMGLDVAFLAWALRTSRRAARAYERVIVRHGAVVVLRSAASGVREEMTLNPYWLQVRLEEEMEHVRHLYLSSHGRSIEIGRFLPPEERIAVAGGLRAALAAARAWRPDGP